jgi:phage-related minor tail protein
MAQELLFQLKLDGKNAEQQLKDFTEAADKAGVKVKDVTKESEEFAKSLQAQENRIKILDGAINTLGVR